MNLPAGVVAQQVLSFYHDYGVNTCIISTTNDLYCAGRNTYGQLGLNRTATFEANPQQFVLPAGVYAVKQLSVYYNLFVLGSDGNVYGAGDNSYGQLGDGTTNSAHTPVRFDLPTGVQAIDVVRTGLTNISVLASDGNVYSAGQNFGGMFGMGSTGVQPTPVVFQLPGGVTAVSIAPAQIGFGFSPLVVIGSDGNAYAAGTNTYGQVGSGSVSSTVTTPEVFALPGGVSAVSARTDNYGTYVIGSDGNLYGAGRNNRGQLGDGTTTLRRSPVVFQLPGALTAQGVYNDKESVWVLASDGQIYGAGLNSSGQLGDTTQTNRSTPVLFQLPGALTVSSINNVNGYQQQSFQVLASDGNVYSAGTNSLNDSSFTPYARFGNGTPAAAESTPVKFDLPVGVTATQLVKGLMPLNTAVIGSDGNLYAAGVNLSGFGGGAPYASSTPVQMVIPGDEAVTSARSEYSAMFAVTTSGKLFSAGCNSFTIASEPYITDCPGWLGTGDYQGVESSPMEYVMPAGLRVLGLDVQSRETLSILTTPWHAVGGQVYCDANDNGTQDIGEDLLDAQTVSVYRAVGGSPSGPALATYSTQDFNANSGVYFFDGLESGDYILGLSSGATTLYSATMTINGSGDGWILGSSAFVNSASAMGQTGVVCGTSTSVPNVPPTSPIPQPQTPSTLVPTGTKILLLYAIATLLVGVAVAIGAIRKRYVYQLAR